MDDLISRQAAINEFLTELTRRERNNLLHTWSTVEVKYFITKMLEGLPPAQPEWSKDEEWNGIDGKIIAPKGTFDKIFNDNDTEDNGI